MATVPRYESAVTPKALPSPNVLTKQVADTAIGEGLEVLGNAAVGTGNKLADLAIRKQAEVDAQEFNLVKARVDSFFDQQFEEEKNNPDYDGMNGRVDKAFGEFSQGLIDGASNDRVKQKVSQYLPVAREISRGKFLGLLYAKQDDKKLALFNEAMDGAVKRLDFGEVQRLVSTATWIPESKRQTILSNAEKKIQLDDAKSILRADPEAVLDKGKYTTFDTNDWEEVDGVRDSEKAERERVKKEAAVDLFYATYDMVRNRKFGGYAQTVAAIKERFSGPDQVKMKWALIDEARQEFDIKRDGTSGSGGSGGTGVTKENKTDPATYKAILGMVAHGTLFTTHKSASSFYDAYKDKLSPSLMGEFIKAYKRAGADDTTDLITLTTKSSVDNVIPKSIKDDETKYVHFIRTFNDEVKRRIGRNGAMDILDQVKLAKDLATEITVDKGSFAEVWHDPDGNFFDVTKRRYELVRNSQGKLVYLDKKGKWRLAPEEYQD